MQSEIDSYKEDLEYQLKRAEDGLNSIVKANGDKKQVLVPFQSFFKSKSGPLRGSDSLFTASFDDNRVIMT